MKRNESSVVIKLKKANESERGNKLAYLNESLSAKTLRTKNESTRSNKLT